MVYKQYIHYYLHKKKKVFFLHEYLVFFNFFLSYLKFKISSCTNVIKTESPAAAHVAGSSFTCIATKKIYQKTILYVIINFFFFRTFDISNFSSRYNHDLLTDLNCTRLNVTRYRNTSTASNTALEEIGDAHSQRSVQ